MIHLVRRIASAIVHVGSDGRITDLGGWAELSGLDPAQSADGGWLDVIHDDDKERVGRAWQTAKDHGTDYNTEMRVRSRDGSYRWFSARAAPHFDENGNLRGWVVFLLPMAGGLRRGDEGNAAAAGAIDAAALRAARAMLNWSAEDLARHAGISRSTVRRLESEEECRSVQSSTAQLVITTLSNAGLRLLVSDRVVDGVRAPLAPEKVDNVLAFRHSAAER